MQLSVKTHSLEKTAAPVAIFDGLAISEHVFLSHENIICGLQHNWHSILYVKHLQVKKIIPR